MYSVNIINVYIIELSQNYMTSGLMLGHLVLGDTSRRSAITGQCAITVERDVLPPLSLVTLMTVSALPVRPAPEADQNGARLASHTSSQE